jgi:hypothetical protein
MILKWRAKPMLRDSVFISRLHEQDKPMPTGVYKRTKKDIQRMKELGSKPKTKSEYNKKVAFKLREKTWRDLHALIAAGQLTKFIDAVLTRELFLIRRGDSEFQRFTKPE